MLNAVNINLVAFSRFHGNDDRHGVHALRDLHHRGGSRARPRDRHPALPRRAGRRCADHIDLARRDDERSPIALVLIALLLPAASFLVHRRSPPLRRSGRPAAWFSIAVRAGAFVAAVCRLAARREPRIGRSRAVWTWLPSAARPLATVGVLVDPTVDDDARARHARGAARADLLARLPAATSRAPALGRYYAYQSLFAFSMMGVVLAPNLLQLFICWELVGVCSYLLIGFWYRKPEAARAALKAFWTTKAGDVGPADRHRPAAARDGHVRSRSSCATWPRRSAHRRLAGLGVDHVLHLPRRGGKSAQFPLHVWLPDAMEGPTPGLGADPRGDDGDGGRVSADAARRGCSR